MQRLSCLNKLQIQESLTQARSLKRLCQKLAHMKATLACTLKCTVYNPTQIQWTVALGNRSQDQLRRNENQVNVEDKQLSHRSHQGKLPSIPLVTDTTRSDYSVRSAELLQQLNWQTLSRKRTCCKAIISKYKVLNGLAPDYLRERFSYGCQRH